MIIIRGLDSCSVDLKVMAKSIARNLQMLFSAALAAVDLHHTTVVHSGADLPVHRVDLAP
jgi:hypothetical protein